MFDNFRNFRLNWLKLIESSEFEMSQPHGQPLKTIPDLFYIVKKNDHEKCDSYLPVPIKSYNL